MIPFFRLIIIKNKLNLPIQQLIERIKVYSLKVIILSIRIQLAVSRKNSRAFAIIRSQRIHT